jgi:hypothetical protein
MLPRLWDKKRRAARSHDSLPNSHRVNKTQSVQGITRRSVKASIQLQISSFNESCQKIRVSEIAPSLTDASHSWLYQPIYRSMLVDLERELSARSMFIYFWLLKLFEGLLLYCGILWKHGTWFAHFFCCWIWAKFWETIDEDGPVHFLVVPETINLKGIYCTNQRNQRGLEFFNAEFDQSKSQPSTKRLLSEMYIFP